MSNTINNGGHAFPHSLEDLYEPNTAGMTLRDYFAAKAMQAYIGRDTFDADMDDVALDSYHVADAMLRARGEAWHH